MQNNEHKQYNPFPRRVEYRGYDIVLSWGEYDVYKKPTVDEIRAGKPTRSLARAPMVDDAKDYVDHVISKFGESKQ